MKHKSDKQTDLQGKIRKLKEWNEDWGQRLDKNSAGRAALDLSKPADKLRLDELLAEEDELKREFSLLRAAGDEVLAEVAKLMQQHRMNYN